MDNEQRVLDLLKKSDMHGAKIAETLKLHPMTVNRLLAVMEAKKLIEFDQVGNAKLWRLVK